MPCLFLHLTFFKIVFQDELNGRCLVPLSVDGVHCPVNEPSHPTLGKNPAYYSHKLNKAGLDYELAMSTYRNALAWINGPFPASHNDKTIFANGLGLLLKNGRKAIADHGYRGHENIMYANSFDTDEVRTWKGRATARQENFNCRIKTFKCLSERFRHDIKLHKIVFYAVCVICQYQLENGSPLPDI